MVPLSMITTPVPTPRSRRRSPFFASRVGAAPGNSSSPSSPSVIRPSTRTTEPRTAFTAAVAVEGSGFSSSDWRTSASICLGLSAAGPVCRRPPLNTSASRPSMAVAQNQRSWRRAQARQPPPAEALAAATPGADAGLGPAVGALPAGGASLASRRVGPVGRLDARAGTAASFAWARGERL